MDLPTYLDINDTDSQRLYQQELSQTLINGLSNNGWTVPQLTDAQLRTDVVLDPNTGANSTLKDIMPDGTIWFITDATPPCYVGKISGSLVKFTTTVYP